LDYALFMIQYDWSDEKNRQLKQERGVSFENVILYVKQGNILDIVDHPNKKGYPHQKIIIIRMLDYVYAVPFVEKDNVRFLKTIIPSRKSNKKYKESK